MKHLKRNTNLVKELNRLNGERQSAESDAQKYLELDLKVHQIELEMQNQALKDAQHEIELSRDRYATLYDFSPIGFVTLNKFGIIKELNLAAAAILGQDRPRLMGGRFFRFIAKDDKMPLQRFLQNCQRTQAAIVTEVQMAAAADEPERILELHGHRLPTPMNEEGTCQLALMDITERRQAEQALQRSNDELEMRVAARTEELCRANQALKELSFHLQQIREEERTRIAREIHDDLGGALTAIKYELCTARRHEDRDQQPAAGRSSASVEMIDVAIHSLRRIITNLRPSILDEVGLWAALEWQSHEFQEQSGIQCTFRLCGEERELEADRATAVFRIVQEALTNVARHAEASSVQILARVTQREMIIKVRDNGKGITKEQIWNCKSFGIRGMQERARAFHFSLRFTPNRTGGTTVLIRGPLAPERPALLT